MLSSRKWEEPLYIKTTAPFRLVPLKSPGLSKSCRYVSACFPAQTRRLMFSCFTHRIMGKLTVLFTEVSAVGPNTLRGHVGLIDSGHLQRALQMHWSDYDGAVYTGCNDV